MVLGVRLLRPPLGVQKVRRVQWVRDVLEFHWNLEVHALQPLRLDQVDRIVLEVLAHHQLRSVLRKKDQY